MNTARGARRWRAALHLLVLRPFVKLFAGINVRGREHLRHLDRFILIANHNSHLDTLLLFHLLPIRLISITHPVADRTYFSRWRFVFWLVDFLFQPIWIERGHPDPERGPLAEIEARIESGHSVILFPEGTRGEPGALLPFRSGIGRLAAGYPDLPIVPVFLAGPERVLPRSSRLPLPFWTHIVVGPPRVVRGTHRDITRTLESLLAELSRSAGARRHRRPPAAERPAPVVALLGIDGSGKSTVARAVARRWSGAGRVGLVTDGLELYERGAPQHLQPLLTDAVRRLIGARARKARSLARYKIPKLAELLLRDHLVREVRRWYRPDLIVLDGSPLLNMVAWAVLYRERLFNEATCARAIAFFTSGEDRRARDDSIVRDFPELAVLRRLKLDRLTLPDAVVLLDVDPATACRRTVARGAPRQVHETEEKLAKLRDAYRLVCGVVQRDPGIPTLRADAERTPEHVAAAALAFLGRLWKDRPPGQGVNDDGLAH